MYHDDIKLLVESGDRSGGEFVDIERGLLPGIYVAALIPLRTPELTTSPVLAWIVNYIITNPVTRFLRNLCISRPIFNALLSPTLFSWNR